MARTTIIIVTLFIIKYVECYLNLALYDGETRFNMSSIDDTIKERAERALMSDKDLKSEKVLSRKRRYLLFPTGSSLQLVYCLTMPVLGQANIFTIGGTAALAWQLPYKPSDWKKHRKLKATDKTDNINDIKYVDTSIKKDSWYSPNYSSNDFGASTKATWNEWLDKGPAKFNMNKYNYKGPHYANIYKMAESYGSGSLSKSPSFQHSAKRKIFTDNRNAYNKVRFVNPSKYDTYSTNYEFNSPTTTYVNPVFHDVHRRTRRELYSKLEAFFEAQNFDGTACLLKAICEISQASNTKGGFMEEILKTVFKPKFHDTHDNEDEYDAARNNKHDCEKEHPKCSISIWRFL